QIDIAPTFNTPWLINTTVGDETYTPATWLSDGTWFWRVAGIDGDGDRGLFSIIWAVEVDTTAPNWDELPESQVIEFGSDFRYDLNVSDTAGISKWWIDDTIHFEIDNDGVLTNIVPLPVGDYGVQVWVNDTLGNIQTAEFTVTVQDTTPPSWSHSLSDHLLEISDEFYYDLNATDLSELGIWWVNDTANFAVDSDGVVTSIRNIPCGTYGLEVRVYDIYNNPCIGHFTVTIEDTSAPSWIVTPSDIVLEYGVVLDYQLQATDLSGIDYYECNDTLHFSIDATGWITNATTLEAGIYGILVKVYDSYGNSISAEFAITVQEPMTTTTSTTTTTTTTTSTTSPTPTTPTTSIEIPLEIVMLAVGGIAGVIVIIIVVILRKRGG
ncbi:MAG: hypothetical protein ACFE7R_07295, partial [Candidatus Hodarchaeota archaeon]